MLVRNWKFPMKRKMTEGVVFTKGKKANNSCQFTKFATDLDSDWLINAQSLKISASMTKQCISTLTCMRRQLVQTLSGTKRV